MKRRSRQLVQSSAEEDLQRLGLLKERSWADFRFAL